MVFYPLLCSCVFLLLLASTLGEHLRLGSEANEIVDSTAKVRILPRVGAEDAMNFPTDDVQDFGDHFAPRRLDKEPLLENEPIQEVVEDPNFYNNLFFATVCVCVAALAQGLTMGLLSLDPQMLHIKQRAGASQQEKKNASTLLPLVQQHHLVLVSLILLNSAANEALPLFLDKLVPSYVAVIISVTLVLFFGEIIPSAVFTGPDQIRIASRLSPLVRIVMVALCPIAYPIAKVLDIVLHDDENDNVYNRSELSALVRLQYEERKKSRKLDESHSGQASKEQITNVSNDVYTTGNEGSSGPNIRPEVAATVKNMKDGTARQNLMAQGDLHVDEVTMVEGALQMRTTTASDVFTPWSDVFTIPHDIVIDEKNQVKIYRSGFSRIPIYEMNQEDPHDNTRIRGILSSRQLIVVDSQHQRPLSTLPIATPPCVAPDTTLVDLVNIFQIGGVKGSHLALVCARPEDGTAAFKKGKPLPSNVGLMGLVTLEDVLESLIQEQIYDEYDRRERERLQLARWGLNRWKTYVNSKKHQQPGNTKDLGATGTSHESFGVSHPREDTSSSSKDEGDPLPTETTSLLRKLNIFNK